MREKERLLLLHVMLYSLTAVLAASGKEERWYFPRVVRI